MLKEKLKELKMPSKKSEEEEMDPMLELELDMEGMEEGEEEKTSPLADIADEDLLAEIKKRGLKMDYYMEKEDEESLSA